MAQQVRYKGQTYEIDDDVTVSELKEELKVPQDNILVDDQGNQLNDLNKVSESVEDGAGVVPLVQPRYG